MVQPNDAYQRTPEPTQMVAVDVYQRVHEGQNLVTELQAYAAFLARGSAQPDGKTGLFYSRDHNPLGVGDISNLGIAWQHDPSHQRVILAPATTSPVNMPEWTRQVMAAVEKGLGHETPWVATDHRAADGSLHTHVIIRNEAKYLPPQYWYIDYQASSVLTDMLGPPDRQELWRQTNREPGVSVAQEQVHYVLSKALVDQARDLPVAGLGVHSDAARPLYGTLIGKGRTDELTEDRFILLQSEGQRISYYRVDSSPLPGPGDHVYVNPALIQREKLASHILDRVMHSLDGKTYTAPPSRHEHDIFCRNLDPVVSEKLWGLVEAQGRLLSELSERSNWQGHILKQDHHVYQFTPQGLDNLEFGRNLSRPSDLHILAVHQQRQAPSQERPQEQYIRHHLGYDQSL